MNNEKKEIKTMDNNNKEVKKAEDNCAEVLEEDSLDAVCGGITPVIPPPKP